MLFYCASCNTGYVQGVPAACPVCQPRLAAKEAQAATKQKQKQKRKRVVNNSCVSAPVKLRVLRRDSFTCQACGVPGGNLTVDHIVPRSKGGSNKDHNLQAMCFACNQAKGDALP